ncbi:Sec61beta family protein [uncultured archaeon]|nr:Sec61beta family protein [uncultured archaeon]
MKFTQSGSGVSGPSSSIGIIRFFDTDSGGPKITPEFVVGVSVVFALILVALRVLAVS